jgi:uncharacterized protein
MDSGSFKRPNIRAHNNPVMHAIGCVVRMTSNLVLSVVNDGKLHENQIEFTYLRVQIKNLGTDFVGYRVLHFSDIHLGTWMNEKRLEALMTLINRQEPDLICITGDFLTHSIHGSESVLTNALSRLTAKDGVLAVLGNHDHWSDPGLVRRCLAASQIRELRNETVTLQRGGSKLYISGVDDVYNQKDRLDLVVNQVPDDAAAVILVHVPDFADLTAACGKFSLQISGHSHGGQVVLPWIGSPVLPPLGRKYVRGKYQINGMTLYTNRGVGTATLPIRLNCPPEISIYTLHPATEP